MDGSGLYFMRIVAGERSWVYKVVKYRIYFVCFI